MKYLIFGTGEYYSRYKKWFEKEEIAALIDNAPEKQGTCQDEIQILSPEQGVQLDYDRIMILSVYVKEMKRQLVELGVPFEKIYHYYDLNRLICRSEEQKCKRYKKPVQYYSKTENMKGAVLLLSHDLALGGPAIALFNMAKVLKKQGHSIVFASTLDGPLRVSLLKEEIPVIIDVNLQIETMNDAGWIVDFSLLVCNTLNFYVFLSERDTKIPVVWWLHDSAFFYEGVDREVMRKISLQNLKVVSVGPVPECAIRDFMPNLDCGQLLYGVENMAVHGRKKRHSKTIRFVTVGFLEYRKGQDVLVQAVKLLPEKIRECCEFYLVGQEKSLFGEKIQQESRDVREIVITGSVDREKIHGLLKDADVFICPSRQDPMPTAAAEAMMHSIPCIVSDAAGTAAYIEDEKNGLVFHSEDAGQLATKIEWCVQDKDKIEHMGKEAQKLYASYFSMEVFEKQLLELFKFEQL